jgi:hypothetical protein
MQKILKIGKDIITVTLVIIFVIIIVWQMLLLEWFIGVTIIAIGFLPFFVGIGRGVLWKSMIPDLIFGAIDTGLLTICALIGAKSFGILGAVIGGVVGDAITDGIAGFFEGGIAEWLRKRGIESSRTAIGCSMGKMTGCFFGCGIVLTFVAVAGIF